METQNRKPPKTSIASYHVTNLTGSLSPRHSSLKLAGQLAPVSVHVGRLRPLLAREERHVVLGADDVCLGQLDSPTQAVVPGVIGGGAQDAVHQLLIVLHDWVSRVLTGAGAARVVRPVDEPVDNLVLGPDGELGQTRVVEELAAAGHVAPCDLVPVALPAHPAHVSALPAGLAPELVHAHLVRVDPDTGGVVVGGALAPASPHLQIVIESS